jgi:hypothetical protein
MEPRPPQTADADAAEPEPQWPAARAAPAARTQELKQQNNYVYIYIYIHTYILYIYIYMYISQAVSTVGVLVVFFLYGCLLPQISLLCGRKLFAQAAVPTSLVDGGVGGLHIYVHTCEGVAPISRYVDAYMCFESSDNS